MRKTIRMINPFYTFFVFLSIQCLKKLINKWIPQNFSVSSYPVVNFANIVWAAFTREDPKRVKKNSQAVSLLGSAFEKAARKMLMKFRQYYLTKKV